MLDHELDGLHVLVTRPPGQAEKLSTGIRQLGGNPLPLPLLEISPVVPADNQLQSALTQIDLVIFISANAVEHGLLYLNPLPAQVQVAAIGQATAEHLHVAGIEVTLVPARFDSEGLLALPQLQDLQGKVVLIVRGVGGREKLAQTLRQRGAHVSYLEVYQRTCPAWRDVDVARALRADIITITSGEALENLATLACRPGAGALWSKPLLVFHERIASHARELGFKLTPVVAAQPGDDALLDALVHWQKERKRNT